MTGPAADGTGRPPAEVVIGLDVGTTAVKAVAFGIGTPWRHVAVREHPLLSPRPGQHVQDPAVLRAAVLDALAEAAAATGGATITGLSVSTAMHGLVGLDGSLQPLTPIVTWADARSRPEAAELRRSGQALDLYRRSGTPVHPMTPLTKLMWFRRHEPELTAGVRWWAGLKDYVLAVLTGTLVTELSSASGTGLLDLETGTWDPDTVALAGVPPQTLPPVLPTTAPLTLTASVRGLPAGLPVITGAGDGPLGNLGTGALEPGTVGLSIGTSGAARMVVPEPMLDPDGRLFCYALTADTWVVGGAVSNGGSVLRWVRRLLGGGSASVAEAELLDAAAHTPAGADGLVMLPFLLAERAPLWDPDLTGALLGLRADHGPGHVVRAAVEGAARQLWAVVDALDRMAAVREVRATGGVFRSPLWRQVVADILGRPLTVTSGAEGSARGAAALGLLGLGRASTPAEALTLLPAAAPAASSPARVDADPGRVAHYTRIRQAVPALLASYEETGRVLAGLPAQDTAALSGRTP